MFNWDKFHKACALFDEAFKDMDKEFAEMKVPAGTEHETVVEETRPDGTKVVTKTTIRRSP